MERRSFLKTVSTSGLLMVINPTGIIQVLGKSTDQPLAKGFANPPSAARPHTYWFWMNGNITDDGITRDLESMKQIGVAGFLNLNCGVAIPKGPVVYLSPEWISLMEHTAKEAERLGLEFAMHNSPGWSSTGGPWITPELSMQKVVWTERVVKDGSHLKMVLPQPSATANYYRDTYVIAFPSSPEEIRSLGNSAQTIAKNSHNRLQGWMTKAGYERAPETLMMEFAPFAGAKPKRAVVRRPEPPYEVPKDAIVKSESIIDITKYMNAAGELEWDAPEGHWTILRMGHTSTGSTNRAAPDNGQGLECDKLSREAFDMHFNSMFQHLLPFMKNLANKTAVGIEIDSYEVGMQNWTKGFAEAFRKNRGYDITKYLPAMTGRVVNSTRETEGFLWDLRRVIADMMADNYYGRCAELCKQHNLVFYGEPYKLGPFESLQAGSRIPMAMGEFWSRSQRNKHAVKLAASVQHINGRKVVGAESFTGQASSSKWQQFPFSLKAQGDYMFTKGLNRMVFHVFAHQVHPTAKPGMTMGQFGTHFDRNNTWFEKGTAWIDYLSRCQFLLQQGLFVADIAYYTGEDGPGEDIGTKETPLPMPPVGYDYDYLNTEVLMNRVRVQGRRMVLPDGMSYSLMILPLKRTMSVTLLRHLRELVSQGLSVMGARPLGTPGLPSAADDREFQKLVGEIWGDLDGKTRKVRTLGSGKIFWEDSIQKVLDSLQVKPDFAFSSQSSDPAINFIHRRDNGTEIYFINNRRRRREHLTASFRVNGKQPEFWDAVTGEMRPAPVYQVANGEAKIPLQLEEAGSLFVVFREQAPAKSVVSVKKGGAELLGVKAFSQAPSRRYQDLVNTFTITTWIKPECEIIVSGMNTARRLDVTSYVLYPAQGERMYRAGHSICGITAGRNGVVVYERKVAEINPVLEVLSPISGWTHLAVVYENGAPSVYLNGELKSKGKASGNIVHPAVREEYQDVYSLYFEGDMTPAEVTKGAFSTEKIKALAGKKPNTISKYPVVEATGSRNDLLIWENGNYSLGLNNGTSKPLNISGIENETKLNGPWQITFPPNLGAPASATVPELISLHKHADDGVRYFSGTASYHKNFMVSERDIAKQNRLYLDLGQVEVLAEVFVNGKDLGIHWKRPYRVDITDAVKTGENQLLVKVTTLWPNRLIGDEQLPEEYSYANDDSGRIKEIPAWFIKGEPRPKSDRIAFATWKHFQKNSPLLESGLIGPVTLRRAVSVLLEV